MDENMTAALLAMLFLMLLFWGLLKLRSMRERVVKDQKPVDKITVLLGMFYTLSRACLQYYRDRNAYPMVVSGHPDGLLELGYLKSEPVAGINKTLQLFSIVVTEKAGWGICLAHIKASLANEIVRRVDEARVPFEFMDYKSGQYRPLTGLGGDTLVNLTLPLPVRPVGSSAPPVVPATGVDGVSSAVAGKSLES
ncbi:MAG: hypothetical protein HQM02_00235 [Magnetococcales bacterium]|nr:hypothetical protein [Magnetococcales bacterium]